MVNTDYSAFKSDEVLLDNGTRFRPTAPNSGEVLLPDGKVRPVTDVQILRDYFGSPCPENQDVCIEMLVRKETPAPLEKTLLGSFSTSTSMLQFPWRVYGIPAPTAADRFDVNGDLQVSAADTDKVINAIRAQNGNSLVESEAGADRFEVNGDGFVSAVDALMAINYLNAHPGSSNTTPEPKPSDANERPFGSELFTVDRATAILDYLDTNGETTLEGPLNPERSQLLQLDENRDNHVALLDALGVLNELRLRQRLVVSYDLRSFAANVDEIFASYGEGLPR